MEVVIVGIDAKHVHPTLCFGDQVFVGEHVDGDADGEECESFEEFEGGDEHEAAGMLGSGWHLAGIL